MQVAAAGDSAAASGATRPPTGRVAVSPGNEGERLWPGNYPLRTRTNVPVRSRAASKGPHFKPLRGELAGGRDRAGFVPRIT